MNIKADPHSTFSSAKSTTATFFLRSELASTYLGCLNFAFFWFAGTSFDCWWSSWLGWWSGRMILGLILAVWQQRIDSLGVPVTLRIWSGWLILFSYVSDTRNSPLAYSHHCAVPMSQSWRFPAPNSDTFSPDLFSAPSLATFDRTTFGFCPPNAPNLCSFFGGPSSGCCRHCFWSRGGVLNSGGLTSSYFWSSPCFFPTCCLF